MAMPPRRVKAEASPPNADALPITTSAARKASAATAEMLSELAADAEESHKASPESIKAVMDMGRDALDTGLQILAKQAEIKLLENKQNDILTRLLPEAMEAIGMREVTMSTGEKISVEQLLFAHVSAENKAKAFAWLRAQGHDDLIKNTMTVRFGKGEDDKADLFARFVAHVIEMDAEKKEDVHAQTLQKFVRDYIKEMEEEAADMAENPDDYEKDADGNPVTAFPPLPLDVFGVHNPTVAKISIPKEKKPAATKKK